MGYINNSDDPFNSAKPDMIKLLKSKLCNMKTDTKAEFIMDMIQKANPDLTTNQLVDIIEQSALYVI